MARGNLRHRLLSPNRFQCHPRLKCRRMVPSWLLHGFPPSGYVSSRAEIHLYPCLKYRSHLCVNVKSFVAALIIAAFVLSALPISAGPKEELTAYRAAVAKAQVARGQGDLAA